MQKIAKKPKASRALMVTGLVFAIAGGVIFAGRNRGNRLTGKEHKHTIENLAPWDVVGYSDL